ncbi:MULTISPECIES: helix-turn-helix domain-containing protein [Enterococcus]|uniref:Helix-turn-helix domain-containing protein n=1 Tax=Candidatus Enterococcus mangumiae TaxID=2230878 RepID=A0ABZ2T018_9ENTE|nr:MULTISPECIES: helix-turn-helix domain-containing protein [unclassified Enterococcus]MBO0490459.1 helix-turn-helix domain-containing protein [Enterococcus sp. DIV1094]MBO1300443.1 helix-turn-helix domain-containing protein [Enterococcus sp. DIV1271a]
MGPYYSVNQLAELLGVTTRSVRNYLREGKLHGTKVGGKWRFSEEDLSDFLQFSFKTKPSFDGSDRVIESAVVLKFYLQYESLESLHQFRDRMISYHQDVYSNKEDRYFFYNVLDDECVEFIISGNFNYVQSFGAWFNEAVLKQTDIWLSTPK